MQKASIQRGCWAKSAVAGTKRLSRSVGYQDRRVVLQIKAKLRHVAMVGEREVSCARIGAENRGVRGHCAVRILPTVAVAACAVERDVKTLSGSCGSEGETLWGAACSGWTLSSPHCGICSESSEKVSQEGKVRTRS